MSPRLILIVAALLCGGGPAWAGGGGAASAAFQAVLNTACTTFGISLANCPTPPTMNQVVIETAAIEGITPAEARAHLFSLPTGTAFDAGTLVNTTTGASLSNPLAFIASQGQVFPTSPTNPAANSFLSATTNTALTTLNLTFDFEPRTSATFSAGQEVGDITLPLVVANASQNLVRDVTATLNVIGTGVGSGVTTDIVGNFLGTGNQTEALSALGMTSSLNFNNGYLQFDVGVPLLVTSDIAPAYVFSAPGFEFDTTDRLFDGIDPIASPLAASFVNNAGNLVPAVYANLAIAYDGTTIISAPVVPEPSSLALLGGGLAGLALWRRRRRAAG